MSTLANTILIAGVGRSGTSLLQSMLSAHSAVCFTPETHFHRHYVAARETRARLEAAGARAFAQTLSADPRFARLELAPEELLARELSGARALDLAEVYRRMLARYAERHGARCAGDKDPRSIEHLPALARDLPGAVLLHVVRDPRDVLLSRTRAAWSARRPWWSHALICREQLRRGRSEGRAAFGERYLELRYEDLIAAPETTLRRVTAHAGLEFEAGMLDFGESARRLVAADELSWKRETLGPLLADNRGKWARDLTAFQIRLTESLCDEALAAFDYAAAGPEVRPAAMERAALGLLAALRPLSPLAYRLGSRVAAR